MFRISVADFHFVKPGLIKHVLAVWMGYKSNKKQNSTIKSPINKNYPTVFTMEIKESQSGTPYSPLWKHLFQERLKWKVRKLNSPKPVPKTHCFWSFVSKYITIIISQYLTDSLNFVSLLSELIWLPLTFSLAPSSTLLVD